MKFEPGSKIGDYEVLGSLGVGGMGRVYKVRNELSDRLEAMKVLLPDLEGQADLASRFLREIKVQAGLDHPNIAKLYTALRIDNQLLMCMELVQGIALDERLRKGPIPLVDAVDYMVQVLSALEYAHQRGVVHRDIKPANMMLMPAGTLKLLDFGIAKATIDNWMTMTGTTLGSLYYMSPEQIESGQVDGRSDVYSVGVSLYELVTGEKPFDAESQFAIMSAHLARTPVPPMELNPSLPSAVSEIILTAMAKEPAARFQSAGAFSDALREVQAEVGFGAGTAPATHPAKARATGLRMTPVPLPPVRTQPPGAVSPLSPTPGRQEPVEATRKTRGPRLMWVAVGSLCAVGAIVAFIQLGPKGQPSAKEAAPSSVKAGQPPSAAAPSQPVGLTPKPSAMPPAAARPARSTDPGEVRKQPPTRRAQADPDPQAPPQPPVQVQQQASAMGGPQPAMINADRVEIQRLNDRLNLLYGRAKAVRNALMDLQNKQPAQGPHSEWVESFNRMNTFLKQSTVAINDGSRAAATDAMMKAERELESLEKALGLE